MAEYIEREAAMDVREKLVELIKDGIRKGLRAKGDDRLDYSFEDVADYLIANDVTVQDGKPLEAFLHPVDAYKGLKAKYLVFKADTGEIVENCFVLRPDKDHAAVEALRAYASATYNETLAKDIYNWVGKGVTVQECKLGDKIYQTDGVRIYESIIGEITLTAKHTIFVTENIAFDERAIGNNVFLSYDEAEAHFTQPPKGE